MDLRRVALLLGTAALLAAGCSGDDEDARESNAAETEDTAATSAPVPSPGCESGGSVEAGPTQETVESQGEERPYRQFIPEGYDGGTPMPLVLNIHGLGSNAEQQARFTGLEELAEREGFIAVHPQGLGRLPLWNYVGNDLAAGDIGFISELVDALGAGLCLDTSRVYSTGMSNGGLMSSTLACRLPDQIAAASAVAGVAFLEGCDDGPPVALQVIYGTDDVILPYDGGLGEVIRQLFGAEPVNEGVSVEEQQSAIDSIEFPPVDDSMADWVARNGCDPEPTDEEVSAEVTLRTWSGCAAGTALRLYVVDGGGHTWPGSPILGGDDEASGAPVPGGANAEGILGHTTHDIDATELAWEFFQQHQLRTGG